MIPLYELIKRASKGDVLYTTAPARNVTSAASKLGRRVKTERGMYVPNGEMLNGRQLSRILRVQVLS